MSDIKSKFEGSAKGRQSAINGKILHMTRRIGKLTSVVSYVEELNTSSRIPLFGVALQDAKSAVDIGLKIVEALSALYDTPQESKRVQRLETTYEGLCAIFSKNEAKAFESMERAKETFKRVSEAFSR